jgi:hypothetical protein
VEDEIREKIALEIEKEIKPLIDGPGFLNPVGTLQLTLQVIREGKVGSK